MEGFVQKEKIEKRRGRVLGSLKKREGVVLFYCYHINVFFSF